MARIEFLDDATVAACNAFSGTDLPLSPAIAGGISRQPGKAWPNRPSGSGEIAAEFGCDGFQWARAQEDRTRLWKARHDAYRAILASRPGCKAVVTDVCVPISALAEAVEETRADIAATRCRGRFWAMSAMVISTPSCWCARATRPRRRWPRRWRTRMAERALAAGWHDHRRAWRGLWQAGPDGGRTWGGLAGDGRGETRAGPGGQDEPRQAGAAGLRRRTQPPDARGGWAGARPGAGRRRPPAQDQPKSALAAARAASVTVSPASIRAISSTRSPGIQRGHAWTALPPWPPAFPPASAARQRPPPAANASRPAPAHPSASAFSRRPTASAVAPPTPRSISSKISVSPLCWPVRQTFSASRKR